MGGFGCFGDGFVGWCVSNGGRKEGADFGSGGCYIGAVDSDSLLEFNLEKERALGVLATVSRC